MGTGSTLYGIVTGMKSDMSGASEQPRILENKDEETLSERKDESENGPEEEKYEGNTGPDENEVLEIEEVWVHPKDRPTATKKERKAAQKIVKEQQREKRKHK